MSSGNIKKPVLSYVLLLILVGISLVASYAAKKNDRIYLFNLADFDESDGQLRSRAAVLEKGMYTLRVTYTADADVAYQLSLGDDDETSGSLAASSSPVSAEIPFIIKNDTFSFFATFYEAEEGGMELSEVEIVSKDPMNRDALFLGIHSAIMIFIFVWYVKWHRKAYTRQQAAALILICAFAVANFMNFEPYLRLGADVRVHLRRVEGIKDALMSGQLPAILYPYSFNGYGEIGALYPKLFLYPAALMRIFGMSMLSAYKCLLCDINAATLAVAFFSARRMRFDSLLSAVFAAAYTLFPYRLYVMGYSSSALGRGIAMVFLPAVIAGLFLLLGVRFRKDKEYAMREGAYLLGVGMAGILNSHLLNFLLALGLVGLTCLVFCKKFFNRRVLIGFGQATFLALVLSASYIFQLLGYIDSGLNLSYLEFSLFDKLFTPQTYFTSTWNIIGAAFMILGLTVFIRRGRVPNRIKFLAAVAFVLTLFATTLVPWQFLMTIGPVKKVISTLQSMNRLYFIVAVLCPFIMVTGLETAAKGKKRNIAMAAVLTLTVLCAIVEYKAYFDKEIIVDRVAAYTDNEQIEYLPSGTQHSDYRSNAAYVSDPEALHVSTYTKEGYGAVIEYTCDRDGVYAELPMFYYRDTKAVGSQDENVKVCMGDKHRVRVYFDKTDESRQIWVYFYINPLFRAGMIITLFGIFAAFRQGIHVARRSAL